MRTVPFERFARGIGEFQKMVAPDAPDGVCHLYKDGDEKYTFQLPESACKYNCDQLNGDDPEGGWTYVWNPIA